MSAVLAHRKVHKKEFAAEGVNLTVTAYLVQAIIAGLRAVPAANASWSDEGVIIKRTYHIGMAVALPMDANGLGGLIVPVIKNAGDLNLMGIARAVNRLGRQGAQQPTAQRGFAGRHLHLEQLWHLGQHFSNPGDRQSAGWHTGRRRDRETARCGQQRSSIGGQHRRLSGLS
ncbi:MAG: 2-oxo acid dehydrogenase subunit E2, partial [Caldilineaceae bacterium]|nr:2-oxo acid dehydrogenase subunit E2 [Caldilineaceae bacterium]